MRTLGAKDKVITRDFNRMKSYVVNPDGENIMVQARNRFELKKMFPNMVKYYQLKGYDE